MRDNGGKTIAQRKNQVPAKNQRQLSTLRPRVPSVLPCNLDDNYSLNTDEPVVSSSPQPTYFELRAALWEDQLHRLQSLA